MREGFSIFSCWVLAATLASSGSIPAQSSVVCPVFTPEAAIAKISPNDLVFRFEGGFAAVINEIRLDTDGSPVAYHPQNKGTTDLCNGLDPVITGRRIGDKGKGSPCFGAVNAAVAAGWKRALSPTFCTYGFLAPGTTDVHLGGCNLWGGDAGSGEIPLQQEGDPAPGFFVSTTAVTNPRHAGETQQARYIDSDQIPYVVIPDRLLRRGALRKGGVAWAWNPRSDRTASGVFGDTQNKFGEISIAFGQELEKGTISPLPINAVTSGGVVPWPYGRNRKGEVRVQHDPSGPAVFIYFSQLPHPELPNYSPDIIATSTERLIQQLGGVNQLKRCLQGLLPSR